jgi:multicomponent Na+:H+ antiporter subunit D
VVILYNITGHLLMEPIGAAVRNLAATGEYAFPLTITLGLFAVGLALKSALWPFSSWLPDAHASATTASSGILSGLVLKGYIILLIKIIYRMIGPEVVAAEGVLNILFGLGIGAMIAGSLYALRERDIKRMLAYSSVAQIGYIFAGIGLGTETGMICACIQILVHAVTKPMLFCAAGNMVSEAGGHRFEQLRGMGRRRPLLGIAFAAGALSMIGIPLFAGFATKYYLCSAAIGALGWKGIVTLVAVVASTVLNALYYLPALQVLFDREPDTKTARSSGRGSALTAAAIAVFLALQFGLGFFFSRIAEIIRAGLNTLA